MSKLIYEVKPKNSFEAEGLIFIKNEKYPAYDNDGFTILVAENGEFNFSNEIMNKVLVDWELDIIK